MSILQPGQLGTFTGKTGQVVVCKWRGIWVGRKAPASSSAKPTIDQLDGRKRVSIISKFLKVLAEQIAVGWSPAKPKQTPFNEAVGHHVTKAIAGNYPNYHIDFEQVLISRGRGIIDGGFQPEARAMENGIVELTWLSCSTTARITQPTDVLRIIILDEHYRAGRVLPVTYDHAAKRADLKAQITVPFSCMNHPLHVYIFFVSADEKFASTSEYLGIVTPL